MGINFWVIADSHFGHSRLQKYCNRPAGFETIIFNNLIKWKRVNPNDVLIHLGDFAFKDYQKWTKIWNDILGDTKRWLVLGNHNHHSLTQYLNEGWDFVGEDFTLKYMGKIILFSHKPVPDCNFDVNVHGHSHTKTPTDKWYGKKHRLVKMEHGYKPVALNELIK